MEKRVILFFNSKNELDIKIKELYTESEFIRQCKNFLRDIDDEKVWDKKDEPVFIGSNCTISRFKVREVTSITYSIDKAAAIFFDTSKKGSVSYNDFVNSNFYEKSLFTSLSGSSIYVKDLLLEASINSIEPLTNTRTKILNFKKIYSDMDEWLVELGSKENLVELMLNKLMIKRQAIDYKLRSTYYTQNYFSPSAKLNIDYIAEYETIKDKLYDITYIHNAIQGEAITIDDQKYQELSKMFATEEESNIILGMEILANCNFEKSFHYLFILFYDYGQEFSCYNSWNHVNFKSLISKFSKVGKDDPSNFYSGANWMGWNLDFVTKALLAMNEFTPEKIAMIIEHMNPKELLDSKYYDVNIQWSNDLTEQADDIK